MTVAATMLDLVFPRHCASCGRAILEEGSHTCWDCLSSVWMIEAPFCSVCGNPVSGKVDNAYVCSLCKRHKPAFCAARSAAIYRGAVSRMMQSFKYGNDPHLARDFTPFLVACVYTHYAIENIETVIPVPLHHRKERERTYNQSALLAAETARALRKPFLPRGLIRTRPTPSQTRLSSAERRDNVRGAFKVRHPEWIDGRRVLLIDDVMTTGATVSECSRALKDAGAAAVRVATVARG
jgi:ComF family protein